MNLKTLLATLTLVFIVGISIWAMTATTCLLYTSDAADERSSVDLGGRRIIKKNNTNAITRLVSNTQKTNNKTIQVSA